MAEVEPSLDECRRVFPCRQEDKPRVHDWLALRSEEVSVWHDAFQMMKYVGSIVDEVRDAELAAMVGLLRSFKAKAQV